MTEPARERDVVERRDDWLIGDPLADDAWNAIMEDDRLKRARSQLSLHELRLIIGHTQRPYAAEITRLRELLEAKAPERRIEIEAETYRQMHEDAKELGYESILEALEDLERLKNASARRVR